MTAAVSPTVCQKPALAMCVIRASASSAAAFPDGNVMHALNQSFRLAGRVFGDETCVTANWWVVRIPCISLLLGGELR